MSRCCLAGAEIAYDLAQSRAQFASMHHHVDHAVIQKIFGALESLGQFFPNGVLDNALPCKTDECIGFGNLNIAQHGVAGRYTASRGIGKDNDIGEVSGMRSEEQTSELQSLMRISYSVFFLKKKIK